MVLSNSFAIMELENNKDDIQSSIERGRAAEELIKDMFEETGRFTVYDFGYGAVLPEFARRQKHNQNTDGIRGLRKIRSMPDLIMIDEIRRRGILAEIKHYKKYTPQAAYREAKRYEKHWPEAYLVFIADDGIRMELVPNVVKRNGVKMSKLSKNWVPYNVQLKYIECLKALK
jgi:hypothetical protein